MTSRSMAGVGRPVSGPRRDAVAARGADQTSARRPSFDRAAGLDHVHHVPQRRDVGRRVAGDRHEVGHEPRPDGADLVAEAHGVRGLDGRDRQRLPGGVVEPLHERPGVGGRRVEPGVGHAHVEPRDEAHAPRPHVPRHLHVLVHRHRRRRHRPVGLGGRRARLDRLVGEEMEPEGHVDRLAVGGDPARDLRVVLEPLPRVGREPAGVDEVVDPRVGAVPHAVRRQRVGHDLHVQALGLPDGRPQDLHRVLDGPRVRRRGEHAAGRHHLDAVGPELLLAPHRGDDLVERVRLGPEHPAVPGGRRDRRPGQDEARPRDDPAAHRVADREGDLVLAPDVTERRHPAHEDVPHVLRGPQEERLVGLGGDEPVRVRGGGAVHVGVDVDQAGQERDVAEVVDPVGRGDVAGQLPLGAPPPGSARPRSGRRGRPAIPTRSGSPPASP